MAIDLDQQREVIAPLQRSALHVARDEGRAYPERGRAAEEDALFAAEDLALALGDRGDVDVSQARTNLLEDFREDLVLHPGGSPDQRDFLVALDRLDVSSDIDECCRGELFLQCGDKGVRQRPGGNEANGAFRVAAEGFDR